jgi:hypothetical protein
MQRTQKTLTSSVNPKLEEKTVEDGLDFHAPSLAGAEIPDRKLLDVANQSLAPKKPPKPDRAKSDKANKKSKMR